MHDTDTPQQRLDRLANYFRDTYNVKRTDFSGLVQRAHNWLPRTVAGHGNPTHSSVLRSLEALGVNIDWFVNGGPDTNMMVPGASPPVGEKAQTDLHPSLKHPGGLKTVMLPFVSVAARAGFAQTFATQTENAYELRPYINYTSQDLSDCYLVEVDGDSMEPTFGRGSILLVRPMLGDKRFITPGLYVVTFGDYLVVKRIKENRLGQTGTLELYSDNPFTGPIMLQADMIDGANFFKVIEARATY